MPVCTKKERAHEGFTTYLNTITPEADKMIDVHQRRSIAAVEQLYTKLEHRTTDLDIRMR
jgi:hypothetical protein